MDSVDYFSSISKQPIPVEFVETPLAEAPQETEEQRLERMLVEDPKEAMRLLAKARQVATDAETKYKELKEVFEKDPDYVAATSAKKSTADVVTRYTKTIKEYLAKKVNSLGTASVEMLQGVKPVSKKSTAVTDQTALTEWAEKNMPVAVVKTLDMGLIEKYIDAQIKSKGALPPGVTRTEAFEINFASDLSVYLQEKAE